MATSPTTCEVCGLNKMAFDNGHRSVLPNNEAKASGNTANERFPMCDKEQQQVTSESYPVKTTAYYWPTANCSQDELDLNTFVVTC